MLHLVGDTGTMDFKIELSNEQTLTALNCMKHMVGGHEKHFAEELAKLTGVVGECVEAICWEAEDTIETFIGLLENAGRFAVCHGELEFGIASTREQAMTAWKREEF